MKNSQDKNIEELREMASPKLLIKGRPLGQVIITSMSDCYTNPILKHKFIAGPLVKD